MISRNLFRFIVGAIVGLGLWGIAFGTFIATDKHDKYSLGDAALLSGGLVLLLAVLVAALLGLIYLGIWFSENHVKDD